MKEAKLFTNGQSQARFDFQRSSAFAESPCIFVVLAGPSCSFRTTLHGLHYATPAGNFRMTLWPYAIKEPKRAKSTICVKYLLDTNICIYLLKNNPPHVHERFVQHRIGDIGISSITYCELVYGVENSAHPERNGHFLQEISGTFWRFWITPQTPRSTMGS